MSDNDDNVVNIDDYTGQQPPAQPKHDALAIIELANKLAIFKQMYFFMKCSLHNETGTMVLCQINDQSKAQLAINSKNLVTLLQPEFDTIGNALEDGGVDTRAMLAQVEEQYQAIYRQRQ